MAVSGHYLRKKRSRLKVSWKVLLELKKKLSKCFIIGYVMYVVYIHINFDKAITYKTKAHNGLKKRMD